eukprot:g4341.t1
MNSNWQQKVSKYPGAEKYPEGAPRIRPFYWDIAKAYEDEKERQWGKDPRKVVQQIVKTSQVPYWLPPQSATDAKQHCSFRKIQDCLEEMWRESDASAKGAGARAHMDPHCKTTAPRVRAAPEVVARKAAKHFAHKVDFDGDGVISEMELLRASGQDDNSELISFHDTNRDGKVTTAELVASYVMFATSLMEEQPGRTEL